MFYITHTADIQVKNNKPYLFKPTSEALRNIENIVKEVGSPIHVISGDLFEYANPSLSEQELIYQHLVNLLMIPTLKELVIIAGNHDLVKSKIQKEEERGFNAITSFTNVISKIPFGAEKIRYFSTSDVYESRISPNINYVVYSLEDEDNWEGLAEKCSANKTNIVLFHAMLREYVEYDNIPLSAHIKNKLVSIEQFPSNSYILAGDIHKTLIFEGSKNQKFIYPGSSLQHTFSEGTYITISDKKSNVDLAIDKNVFVYTFDDNQITEINQVSYKSPIEYITFTIDTSALTIDELLIQIDATDIAPSNFNSVTNIKIKSNTQYVAHEKQIADAIINKLQLSGSEFYLNFAYDKIKTETKPTDYINSELSKVFDNEDNSIDYNSVLNKDNLNDLVLTDNQLVSLFEETVNVRYTNVKQSLKDEIVTLFKSELGKVLENGTFRYDIVFKNIKTNGFMFLGENDINLDTNCITRILGTNGIGKTTLYKMIRWALKGMIHENMSISSMVKNTLLIFNKNLPDNDFVEVELDLTINGKPVTIKRSATRTWKENTTTEQKISNLRDEYVSNVSRKLEVIMPNGSKNDEDGQKLINYWFSSTIDNLLFLNASKIESIIASRPIDIKNQILRYIGADYIDALQQNDNNVRQEIFSSVTKPKRKSEVVRDAIYDVEQRIENKTKDVQEFKETLLQKNFDLEGKTKMLKDFEARKTSHNNWRQLYIELDAKRNMKLSEAQALVIPENKQQLISVDELQQTINDCIKHEKSLNEGLSKLKDDCLIFAEQENELRLIVTDKLEQYRKEKTIIKNEMIEDLQTSQKELDVINDEFKQILEQEKQRFEQALEVLATRNTEAQSTRDILITKKNTLLNNISNLEKYLSETHCPTCNRIKENITDEKIEQVRNKIVQLQNEIKLVEDDITNNTTLLENISNKKLNIEKQLTLINYTPEDKSIAFKQHEIIDKLLYKRSECQNKIDSIKEQITIAENDISNLSILNVFAGKYNDCFETEYNKYLEIKDAENVAKTKYQTEAPKLEQQIQESNIKRLSLETELRNANTHNTNVDKINREIDELVKQRETIMVIVAQYEQELHELSEKIVQTMYDENVHQRFIDDTERIQKDVESLARRIQIIESTVFNELNNEKQELERELNNIERYSELEIIWKIYRELISDNKFGNIIFDYYMIFLNNTLNLLLEDVPFKLLWTSTSQLQMVTICNGEYVYQDPKQASGMETTFLGLTLIYAIHLLNIKNSVNAIFIDEISGTLNNGNNLSYDAENYQELFVKILSKFDSKSIFIIDHTIDDIKEDVVYEVIPNEEHTCSKFVRR